MTASWCRMRSGDWALRIPGQRWAVAFVWRTLHRGYAYSIIPGFGSTLYERTLAAAKWAAFAQWRHRQDWLRDPEIPVLEPLDDGTGSCRSDRLAVHSSDSPARVRE